jgi:aryl-alcohol dehydrogenase-like predicted oxidoreductase
VPHTNEVLIGRAIAGRRDQVFLATKFGFVPNPSEPGQIVVDGSPVMQENRSFDHAMGALQGVRGFNDPRAIRQANGNSVFLQTSADWFE